MQREAERERETKGGKSVLSERLNLNAKLHEYSVKGENSPINLRLRTDIQTNR